MDIYKYVNKTSNPISIGSINIVANGEYISTAAVPELDNLDGVLVDKYLNGASCISNVEYNSYHPVVSNKLGAGIHLDTTAPNFGWHDLLSNISIYLGGATHRPEFNTLVGTIRDYQFTVADVSYHEYHIPHDYVMGSDLYIHTHWTHNSDAVTSGSVTWQFDATYARGYSRGVYNSPITAEVVQLAPVVPLTHMIAETKLSSADGIGDY